MSRAAAVPVLPRKPDVWDQTVDDSTHKFNYEDSTVRLLVGNDKFRVSRRLLSTASDVFADMFSLPQADESQEIVLHSDPEDFRHFLWILHVDAISMMHFDASASHTIRFQRALGIATVAHMYSATRILAWAVAELLKYLRRHRSDQELMTRAYRLAARIVDNPGLLDTVRSEWIQGLEYAKPVDMLAAAKSVGDHGMLGCAYFVIIQKQTAGWIAAEPSLTPLDRTRLVVGALNLRRWESHSRGSYSDSFKSQGEGVESWSPRVDSLDGVTEWDPQKLWELFSRSPFGLRFDGETDMSEYGDHSAPDA